MQKKVEKCFRCGKILIRFFEIADTFDNKKIKLCEDCGIKLKDWLDNNK